MVGIRVLPDFTFHKITVREAKVTLFYIRVSKEIKFLLFKCKITPAFKE